MDLVLNVVFDLVDDLKGNRCGETLPAAVSGSEVLKAQETAGKTGNETEPNSPSLGHHMLKSHTLKSKAISAKNLSEAGGSVSSRPA